MRTVSRRRNEYFPVMFEDLVQMCYLNSDMSVLIGKKFFLSSSFIIIVIINLLFHEERKADYF